MKIAGMTTLMLGGCLALSAAAQETENFAGAGTPGFLARFSKPHRLTNSNAFQQSNGNIGIGTTDPIVPSGTTPLP